MVGLELLYHIVKDDMRSGHDALVCALHIQVLQQGLHCIGSSDQPPDDVENAQKTELLPNGWNANQDVYTLMYANKDGTLFLLKGLKMDNSLMVHFMRLSDESMADMTISVSQYTTQDLSTFDRAYQNVADLGSRVTDGILTRVLTPARPKSPPAGAAARGADPDPLREEPRRPNIAQPHGDDPNNLFAVGHGDLDPVAAGGVGGGMVFDPLRAGPMGGGGPHFGGPQPLPPGAVPPGARFDPIGPFGPRGGRGSDIGRRGNRRGRGQGFGPDPDHLPPPGFDDMFM